MVTFGDEVTKIRKYYVIFVYILQGKMGKMEKNQERKSRNKSNQNTKNQKTKTWDERNICDAKLEIQTLNWFYYACKIWLFSMKMTVQLQFNA